MKRVLVLVALALVAACNRGSSKEAEEAVRTYLTRMADAYRASDESLVDPLVSEEQGRKLLGLIGVKRDAGVALDATLLEVKFVGSGRADGRWVVETKERWHYRDRKIGSGEQVGEESTDSYSMRYVFSVKDGRFILEELSFIGEPQVGRKAAPMPVDARLLHGLPPAGAEDEPMPPGHPDVGGRPPDPSAVEGAPPAGRPSPPGVEQR